MGVQLSSPDPAQAAVAIYRRRRPEDTSLYRVMQEHLSTFFAMADARAEAGPIGAGLPRHVRREFEEFMACGILARGFCRVLCPDCGQSALVAYSCKARSVCPSCTGRRMAEVAAHLVDHVFPEVPVRQWVLSLPNRVRYLLARHPALCREVRGIFVRAVHSFYSRRAKAQGHPGGRSGSIVQVQRFDSALRTNNQEQCLALSSPWFSKGNVGGVLKRCPSRISFPVSRRWLTMRWTVSDSRSDRLISQGAHGTT